MFRQFKELCASGSEANTFKNVVIATTMWGNVTFDEGERRDQEIREDERFFKQALYKDAKLVRHDDTENSARDILRVVLRNQPRDREALDSNAIDEGTNHYGRFRGPPGDADEQMFKVY
jgi:hypothetical protein